MWHFISAHIKNVTTDLQPLIAFQLKSSVSHDWIVTNLASPETTGIPSPYKEKKPITLGRSVHSGQLSNLGWELRILGPISWFHFCCSQNPSPSSSTQWTEDLGGSILFSLKQPVPGNAKHLGTDLNKNILYTLASNSTRKVKLEGWH